MEALTSRLPALAHLNFTWRDALDIAIVALITYGLLRLIRGTRAVQMVLGLFAIFAVYAVAALFKRAALSRVLRGLMFYVPVAIIVLFSLVGMPVSALTLVIGHTVVCVPYVVRNTVAALAQLEPTLL